MLSKTAVSFEVTEAVNGICEDCDGEARKKFHDSFNELQWAAGRENLDFEMFSVHCKLDCLCSAFANMLVCLESKCWRLDLLQLTDFSSEERSCKKTAVLAIAREFVREELALKTDLMRGIL